MAPSAVQTGPISLPLFKLSFCTTLTPRSPMVWTHLPNRDGMFAVFDQVTAKSLSGLAVGKTFLKCVRGGELIEQVELDRLQQQVRLDEERAGSQQLRDEDRHVIILLKGPLLALRYQLPDGQIRKIQMNFLPTSGCDVAIDIFRSIDIPIRDRSQPLQPVQSQAAALRPQSSQGAFPSLLQPVPKDPNGAIATACNRIPLAPHLYQISSRPTSATTNSTLSSSQKQFSTFSNVIYGSVPPSTKSSQTLSRPVSASTGANEDEMSRPVVFSRDSGSCLGESGNAHITGYNTSPRPSSCFGVFDSKPKPALPPSTTTRLLPSPELGSLSSACKQGARPTSAPQTWAERLFAEDVPLSQMLPPKRELPFPEKKGKGSDRDDGAATAEERMPELSPSGKAKGKATRQTKGRDNVKANTLRRKVSLPTPDPSSSAPKPPPKKKAVAKRGPNKAAPSSAPPMVSSRKASSRAVSPISETARPSSSPVRETSKKRPLTVADDRESNKRRAQVPGRTSSPTVEHHKGPLRSACSNINPTELLDSLDGWIRKFNHLPAPKALQTSKDHLAEYAKQSDEERAKAIDNLICECLQDKNFEKLVEDVEGAWRRIGLGF